MKLASFKWFNQIMIACIDKLLDGEMSEGSTPSLSDHRHTEYRVQSSTVSVDGIPPELGSPLLLQFITSTLHTPMHPSPTPTPSHLLYTRRSATLRALRPPASRSSPRFHASPFRPTLFRPLPASSPLVCRSSPSPVQCIVGLPPRSTRAYGSPGSPSLRANPAFSLSPPSVELLVDWRECHPQLTAGETSVSLSERPGKCLRRCQVVFGSTSEARAAEQGDWLIHEWVDGVAPGRWPADVVRLEGKADSMFGLVSRVWLVSRSHGVLHLLGRLLSDIVFDLFAVNVTGPRNKNSFPRLLSCYVLLILVCTVTEFVIVSVDVQETYNSLSNQILG